MKTTFLGTHIMNKGAAVVTALALILSFVPAFQSAQAATSLFPDGFESDNFTNWTTAGGDWHIISDSHFGSKAAEVKDTGSSSDELRKNIPTSGYQNITLSYWYKIPSGLGSTDYLKVQWSTDGTTWNTIADYTNSATISNWVSATHNLPSGAANMSGFRFRFWADSLGSSDKFRLDDVSLTADAIPTTATLTVIKHVVNNNGGSAIASNWNLAVSSSNGGTGTGNAAGSESGTSYTLQAGKQYSVAESGGPSGYSQSSSSDCTIASVTAGGSYTCTITNDDIAPTLTLVKTVITDNGGTATVSSFPLFIDGFGVTSGVASTTSAGLHTASETTMTGYAPSVWGGNCAPDGTITLAPGDNKSCTITNNDIAPKLTVTKVVVNNDGGSAVASNFPLFVGTTPVTSGAQNTYNAGAYTVSETSQTGYAGTIGDDCAADGTITLNPGDVKTCTITNDDIAPGLTVIKSVTTDNGGTLGAGDFILRVNGVPVTSGVATTTLPAGTYTVSEDPASGYAGTIDGDCAADGSVTIGVGETKVCTITNDDIAPKLHLRKIVDTESGGEATVGDFTLTADGTGTNDLSGTSPVDSDAGLLADTWALSETPLAGYTPSDWVCVGGTQNGSSITLGLGEEATCTITNTFHPEPRDVTAPVSTFGDSRDHQIIDTELVQLSLSGQSTDNVGPDPKSGVASAAMSIFKLADAQTMDGEGFLGNTFPGLTCSLEEQVPIEIVALSLTSVAPLTVSWDPIHQTENPLTSLDRGVYCAVVHATDNAGNVENTAVAGPFAYTFTPSSPTPTPTPSPSGGGGGGGGCATGFTFNPTTSKCDPNGQVLGASTGPAGQVLGVSCGLYMDQHLKKGSAKNKPDQVTKLQQFLNKYGYGTFPVTGFFGPQTLAAVNAFQTQYKDDVLKPWALNRPTSLVYLTTLRRINLLSCPELSIPLPALVPWNANPNAQ